MNAARRKQVETAIAILQDVRDEEQAAFDNLPENLQEGEKGEAMEAAIERLEEAIDALDEVAS